MLTLFFTRTLPVQGLHHISVFSAWGQSLNSLTISSSGPNILQFSLTRVFGKWWCCKMAGKRKGALNILKSMMPQLEKESTTNPITAAKGYSQGRVSFTILFSPTGFYCL